MVLSCRWATCESKGGCFLVANCARKPVLLVFGVRLTRNHCWSFGSSPRRAYSKSGAGEDVSRLTPRLFVVLTTLLLASGNGPCLVNYIFIKLNRLHIKMITPIECIWPTRWVWPFHCWPPCKRLLFPYTVCSTFRPFSLSATKFLTSVGYIVIYAFALSFFPVAGASCSA